MIYKDGHEIIAVNHGRRIITAIYHGARLMWQAIRSCFGAGYWIGEKPWLGDEAWKGTKKF